MIHILQGDCRVVLGRLPAASVHCVVTSPPYYGLRDYGVAEQLGLEPSPDAYIAELVTVFRAIRRVLRDDGTVWLVIGDAYSSGQRTTQCGPSGFTRTARLADGGARRVPAGIAKPKDLLMIPARVALALQADGWWLRSDIIWNKPSCMPESATDRPTNSHEHVFLLTKRERYFWDAEAVAEPAEMTPQRRLTVQPKKSGGHAVDGWKEPRLLREHASVDGNGTRNIRNVWTIQSQPYPGAHFAVMPAELAERCIKAGTPEHGVCATCGAPWWRVTRRGQSDYARLGKVQTTRGDSTPNGYGQTRNGNGVVPSLRARVVIGTDWKRGCRCLGAGRVPATVLDPFAGAFTTALAADRLGRHAIGIELSERYCKQARERLQDDAGLFAALSEHAPTPLDVAEPSQPGLAL